jgi:hypothetical protein
MRNTHAGSIIISPLMVVYIMDYPNIPRYCWIASFYMQVSYMKRTVFPLVASSLFSVGYGFFMCLRSVSHSCLSGLSITDCPSGFLERDSVRCICNSTNTFNHLFVILFITLDMLLLQRNRF